MLGHAPLSTVPLSALPGASSPATVSEVDIILHPIPAGQDICLWDPTEFEDCTPVIPPTPVPVSPGGGGGFLPWNLRWDDEPEDDDLEIVQILTYWLNRL